MVLAEDIARETTDLTRREKVFEENVSVVAEESKKKKETDKYKTGVTYQDILQDPDNIELNYRYAQNQIAKSELLGAAATLERILLIEPNLVDIRLLYAVVLYRLDSLSEAQKELDVLKAVPLPDKIREEMKIYEDKIKSRKKHTKFGIRESIGWGFDTNRNAAPSSKYQLFTEVPLGLTGTNRKRNDTHFMNITTVDVNHDLGFQAGHSVFASFTYYLQEQTMVDTLDLSSYQYELGGTFKSRYVNITPSFVASNIILSRESFLRTQGLNILADHDFSAKFGTYYNFRYDYQDYLDITENTTAHDRKGAQYEHTVGFRFTPVPFIRWTTTAGYLEKDAKQKFNAYDRFSLNNALTILMGKGQFLMNSISLNMDAYEAPELAIAGRHRHDRTFRYRTTYGAPLETLLIGKILPRPLKDITFTFSYEYYRSLSNIANYTYKNNKFQGLLTKRWEF